MELSHFSVLNHMASAGGDRTPAQLAKIFYVTRGAMTNTLGKLEWAGYVHISPDWEDARRKLVVISPAGRSARNAALAALTPILNEVVSDIGPDRVKAVIPVLREVRNQFERRLSED
jgi:DNA-binding MarR family transcriptional regulator